MQWWTRPSSPPPPPINQSHSLSHPSNQSSLSPPSLLLHPIQIAPLNLAPLPSPLCPLLLGDMFWCTWPCPAFGVYLLVACKRTSGDFQKDFSRGMLTLMGSGGNFYDSLGGPCKEGFSVSSLRPCKGNCFSLCGCSWEEVRSIALWCFLALLGAFLDFFSVPLSATQHMRIRNLSEPSENPLCRYSRHNTEHPTILTKVSETYKKRKPS